MKKCNLIAILLAAFLLPEFVYSGSAYIAPPEIAAASSACHKIFDYTEQNDLQPVPGLNDIYSVSSFYAAIGLEKINKCQEGHAHGFNYSLPWVAYCSTLNEMVQEKKYLFYLYPSHNFW